MGRGVAKQRGLETKEGLENDSERLRSPPLRRVASAPRGPSTAAEQSSAQRERERERERREERQAKQAFAAAGSNSMAGAKIRDWSLDPGLLLY